MSQQLQTSDIQLELSQEEKLFIKEKLSSKLWRLDNLYKIRNKSGKLVTLNLNSAQRRVLEKFKHKRKIILKSRQQGISTLYLAYNLDACLFRPGFQAGIQSYGQDEADKLSKRAELMWNELDPQIKELLGLTLVSNNSKGMTFSNGSILKIGNFRGDTLQSLHVSELGKIAKKYPEKAKELKTGAFQAVSKDNIITIESTAEGSSGLFYDMWIKAEMLALEERKLSPLDFQAVFLSWLEDPDCLMDYKVEIPLELKQYFLEIEEMLEITLTDQQKWWYAAKKDELGDDMTQEYPTTSDEAFMSAKDGAYYGKQYRDYIVKRKRLKPNLYDKNLPVHVVFDLGFSDMMVAVFFQQFIDGIRVIDAYYNSGEAIKHYATMLKNKKIALGYKYGDIWLPHDAAKTELGSGKNIQTIFRENGVATRILKRVGIAEGIELVRKWLQNMWIDSGLHYIQNTFINYSKEWDDKLGVWKDKPIHNEWSHPADAIRYMCTVVNEQFKPVKPKRRRKSGYDV